MREYLSRTYAVMIGMFALGAVVLQYKYGRVPFDYTIAAGLAFVGYPVLAFVERRLPGGESDVR